MARYRAHRLSGALAALLMTSATGVAQGVNLATDGRGQVLIYPYYTVNGGYQTLVSVVNTTDRTKAVKVTFREAINGRSVLNFNLYLPPFDVWTAVGFDSDGADSTEDPAILGTSDGSCTVPDIFNHFPQGVPFFNLSYTGSRADGGPQDAARTREGYLEMIEMGELGDTVEGSARAARVIAGEARDCPQLFDAWRTLVDGVTPAPGAYWRVDPTVDLLPPTGGLRGAASLVDVADGQMVTYDAIALDGFWQPDALAMHTVPATPEASPNLAQATFDPDQDGRINSLVLNQGLVTRSDWAVPVDAVSAVLMQRSINNEYIFDPGLGAETDWIISLPTKPFYTDPAAVSAIFDQEAPVSPFEKAIDFSVPDGEPIAALEYFDRETRGYFGDDIICIPGTQCPPIPPAGILPFAVNTLTHVLEVDEDLPFGHYPTITGSLLSVGAPGRYQLGWAAFRFRTEYATFHELDGATSLNGLQREEDGDVYRGLPVVGFALSVLRNGTLVDDEGFRTLAHYAGLSVHTGEIDIDDLPAASDPSSTQGIAR